MTAAVQTRSSHHIIASCRTYKASFCPLCWVRRFPLRPWPSKRRRTRSARSAARTAYFAGISAPPVLLTLRRWRSQTKFNV